MAIAYTNIESDNQLIKYGVLLNPDKVDTPFIMPHITFFDDCGNELETWDNDEFILDFHDKLKGSESWEFIDFIRPHFADSSISLEYILINKQDILDVLNLAALVGGLCREKLEML